MDLTSDDPDYLANSIIETQRVIDITRSLNMCFPSTKRPMIVANIGGFSMDEPLSEDEVLKRYQTFSDSLGNLDLEGWR